MVGALVLAMGALVGDRFGSSHNITKHVRTTAAPPPAPPAVHPYCPSQCSHLMSASRWQEWSSITKREHLTRCPYCCDRCASNARLLGDITVLQGARAFFQHVVRSVGGRTVVFVGDSVMTQIFTWAAFELHQQGATVSAAVTGHALTELSGADLATVAFGSRYFRTLRTLHVRLAGGEELNITMIKIGQLTSLTRQPAAAWARGIRQKYSGPVLISMLPSAHYNVDKQTRSFGPQFGADVGVWLAWLARLEEEGTCAVAAEAPAQHWSHGLNGHYSPVVWTRANTQVTACANFTAEANASQEHGASDADAKVREVARAITRHGASLALVRYARFFEATRPLHSAHAQCDAGGLWDCTHWCYTPGMLEPLWQQLLNRSKGGACDRRSRALVKPVRY